VVASSVVVAAHRVISVPSTAVAVAAGPLLSTIRGPL